MLDELTELETDRGNYYQLAGAIINRALKDYALAYYYKLIGIKRFIRQYGNSVVKVNEEIKRIEKFLNSGDFLIYAMDLVSPDFIRKVAIAEAEEMYKNHMSGRRRDGSKARTSDKSLHKQE